MTPLICRLACLSVLSEASLRTPRLDQALQLAGSKDASLLETAYAHWSKGHEWKEPPAALQKPSDLVIYVTTYDKSPVGNCSALTWISDALEFGFQVVYYGQNATRLTRTGEVIPTRRVPDFGALSGVRDKYDVWPLYTANILQDLLEFSPVAKYVMRLDDDSVLNPR